MGKPILILGLFVLGAELQTSQATAPGASASSSQVSSQASSSSMEGRYRDLEEPSCNFLLEIRKSGDAYSFKFQIDKKRYKGKVQFSKDGDGEYVLLEGIPWLSNNGAVEGDAGVKPVPGYGIEGRLEEGAFHFQNYGNAMNDYVKTACDKKFITLTKDAVGHSNTQGKTQDKTQSKTQSQPPQKPKKEK